MSGAALLSLALAGGCARPPAEAPEPGPTTAEAASTDGSPLAVPPDQLRVCADPNNLPFSNDRGEGFENRLAEMVAAASGRELRYTWWPQRRGFVRNTLNAGACDVIMGVPANYELARTTRPYYRSGYVFVTRRDERRRISSLDDPSLSRLRIGVHVVGDDGSNVAPAQALVDRGIIHNIRGYSIYGNYSRPNPPAELVAAVAAREVDVAIAWGPLAGYFASRQQVPLSVALVPPDPNPALPFSYAIAMAVRRDADELHAALNQFIAAHQPGIDALLREFGVPLVAADAPRGAGSSAQ